MAFTPRNSRVWSEFADGPIGWDLGLNTTMFHHRGLLLDYARAYHTAARLLFANFRQTDESRDIDAHPIVSLYRHALEVYLKTVIDLGNSLLWLRGKPVTKGTETFQGHGLVRLLPNVRGVFNILDCADIWTPIFRSFDDIERVVKAVDEVPHDALRYPVDKTGSRELLPEALCFNAWTFAEKLDTLLTLLHAVAKKTDDTFQTECHRYIAS